MIFRILINQLSMIKSIILTSVISREFRQVLAWLNDERAFSSYYKRYSPADEEKASSSLTLPRNDIFWELGAGSTAILKSSLANSAIPTKLMTTDL